MTKWLWNTKCELCGYTTPFYRRQWVAKALAFWHSVTQHPFGYCTIAAVDDTKQAAQPEPAPPMLPGLE